MKFRELSAERRRNTYAIRKRYRKALKERAYKRLGNVCGCGSIDTLRICFNDPLNPLRAALTKHTPTLYVRILKDPVLASQVALRCYSCRTDGGRN